MKKTAASASKRAGMAYSRSIHQFVVSETMISKTLLSMAFGFGLILAVAGCNSTESGTSDTSPASTDMKTATQEDAEHDHSSHEHGVHEDSDKTDME